MITNQKKQEIVQLAQAMKADIEMTANQYCSKTAGVYNGANRTDTIWVKNEHGCSFFFVSPCLRNARAETFITCDGEYEFTFHAIDRYGQRNINSKMIDVVNAPSDRWARVCENIANFYINEKILGVVGCTRNRGRVIRTTNGVMFCSDASLHYGVNLVNTWIPYEELRGSQKAAVDHFDKGRLDMSKRTYSEYFIVKRDYGMRYRTMTKPGGVGTYRIKKKNKVKC